VQTFARPRQTSSGGLAPAPSCVHSFSILSLAARSRMTFARIFATRLSALQSEQKILERQLKQVKRAVAVLRGLGDRNRKGPGKGISAKPRASIAAAQRAR
jgi:hypothetical protein